MTDNRPTSSGLDLHLELPAGLGRRAALEHALREAIRSGRLAPEARLPATRRLATEFGMARGTIRAAYDQLIAEGYLTAHHGSGTRVARIPALRPTAPAPAPAPTPAPAPAPAAPAPRYDLRPGSPDPASFPTSAWLRATRRALAVAPAEVYGYGDPRGRIELRTALAGYLGRARGVLTTPEQIVVTSGYVQALALLVQVLARAGTAAVAMEDPGLAFHREVVRRHGGTVLPLPVDQHGAGTDRLPAADAVVVTPAHQYPTGASLQPARRRLLVDWARATGALVVEDDYDGEFLPDRRAAASRWVPSRERRRTWWPTSAAPPRPSDPPCAWPGWCCRRNWSTP